MSDVLELFWIADCPHTGPNYSPGVARTWEVALNMALEHAVADGCKGWVYRDPEGLFDHPRGWDARQGNLRFVDPDDPRVEAPL